MSVRYGNMEMPKTIKVDEKDAQDTFARFIVEPLERGYGHTIGNSLRRILLSALEAPAIISVLIEGVSHEFTGIDGIVEDMVTIILNFKRALLRKLPTEDEGSHDYRILTNKIEVTKKDLDANGGQVVITLGDIIKQGNFDIVNADLPIFTVTKPLKKQIDLKVKIGRGYVPSERIDIPERDIDEIVIDACYSPVRLVNYIVEHTRVGQDTDFDKLILEVRTDGRLRPAEALSFAAQIATLQFGVFNKIEGENLLFESGDSEEDKDRAEMMAKLSLRIDEVELSVRSANCLKFANIETIAELVSIPERKLLGFRNFGKKSLTEIKEKLTNMGLYLGMDVSRYDIPRENIKEYMRKYIEEHRAPAADLTNLVSEN